MTPTFGQFPFCNTRLMTAADSLGGEYPIGFTAQQLSDYYFNILRLNFNFNAVPDALDVLLDISNAMLALDAFGLSAIGLLLDPAAASASSRVTVFGTTNRKKTGTCNGTRHEFNGNGCFVRIDFDDVVRQMQGHHQSINLVTYYPRINILFFAAGYWFSNNLSLLKGAGTIIGGIELDFTSGVITNIYCVSGTGPPIGNPSVFGNIQVDTRIPPVRIIRTGQTLVVAGTNSEGGGITGGPILAEGAFPVFNNLKAVRLGGLQLDFTANFAAPSPSRSGFFSVTIRLPTVFHPEPLSFDYENGDSWSTRMPIFP